MYPESHGGLGLMDEYRRSQAERYQRHINERAENGAGSLLSIPVNPLPNPWLNKSSHGVGITSRYDGVVASGRTSGGFTRDLGYTRVSVSDSDIESRPVKTYCLLCFCPCLLGDPCSLEHRNDIAKVAKTFIAIISVFDIIMFVSTLIVTMSTPDTSFVGILAPPACILVEFGAQFTPLMLSKWEVWRLLSATFLHAGPLHLIMNMYVQILLGIQCEKEWGSIATAAIYFASGVGGSLASSVASPLSVGVGASGSIVGLIGARLARLISQWHELEPTVRNSHLWGSLINLLLLSSMGVASNAGAMPAIHIDNFAHGGTITIDCRR